MFQVKYLTNFNKKWLFAGLIFWILSFVINIWPIVFLILFCTLNVFLLLYDRYVEMPVDLELSTFSAVIMSLKFGLGWGILAGVLTKVASMISNRDFNRNSLIAISGYALAALLAYLLQGLPIVTMGVLIAIIVNTYAFLAFRFILFLSDFELALYGISNIFFNIVVFVGFSEIILRLIPF